MADPGRITVEGAELASLFRFPAILRGVTMAFAPPRLIAGLLLVAALMTAGRIWDGLREPRIAPAGLLAGGISGDDAAEAQSVMRRALRDAGVDEASVGAEGEVLDPRDVALALLAAHRRGWAGAEAAARGGLEERLRESLEEIDRVRPRGTFEATLGAVVGGFTGLLQALLTLRLDRFLGAARELFLTTPVALWRADWPFTVVYGLLAAILLALVGGAVSRMTATDFARGDKIGLQASLTFALRSWRRLIFSLLLPMAIAGLLAALFLWILFGVLMLPWVDLAGGPLYGAALLVGFCVVFLLVGYALGFPLLVPAVACENCDAADALQRAYAYVLGRPLHLIGYGAVAVVGLTAGYIVAAFFAAQILNVTGMLVGDIFGQAALAAGPEYRVFDLARDAPHAVPHTWHGTWATWWVSFWQTVVLCLVAGYVFSYWYSASTIVYLLMRRACDGQEIGEIWEPGMVPGTMAPAPAENEEPEDGDDADRG
jgi:hypothetical protein